MSPADYEKASQKKKLGILKNKAWKHQSSYIEENGRGQEGKIAGQISGEYAVRAAEGHKELKRVSNQLSGGSYSNRSIQVGFHFWDRIRKLDFG